MRRTATYVGLSPSSPVASRAARGSSRKRDTKAELLLRRELWARGLRYRIDSPKIAGRPDVAFSRARVAVFIDGDFWHGRDLEERIKRLQRGHNAPYWVKKLRGNVDRDRANDALLARQGWIVLRYWETDIKKSAARIAEDIVIKVQARLR
jgi:DNA mismatch endonuclease (patch repair protein)